jgi:hypothetical protein
MSDLVPLTPTTGNDPKSFAHVITLMPTFFKLADIYSKCDLAPPPFKGSPSNCYAAIETAYMLGVLPLQYMNNNNLMYGRCTLSGPFIISLANRSGKFVNGIEFESWGEKMGFTVCAFGYLKRQPEKKVSVSISLQQAKDAGWGKKDNFASYMNMPFTYLSYRAVASLCRLYIPEVLNGMSVEGDLPENEDGFLGAPDQVKSIGEGQTVTPLKVPFSTSNKAKQAVAKLIGNTPLAESNNAETLDVVEDDLLEQGATEETMLTNQLIQLIETHSIPMEIVDKWLTKANVTDLAFLPLDTTQKIIDFITSQDEE